MTYRRKWKHLIKWELSGEPEGVCEIWSLIKGEQGAGEGGFG
jgi:hypothetical protein